MDYPRAKRIYDVAFAAAGLAAFSPLLLLIAIAVKCGDGGPVFYRQQRVGLFGKRFWIWKFRTMVVNADKIGLSVTKDGDARITPIGRVLRKTKLDELPQLWNVLRGEMSFVGPRPEVPRYVEGYTEEQRQILELKPGITDLASLEFSNEEEILRSASNVEEFYVGYCVPRKIELNRIYAQRASVWQDTVLILKTLFFWCREKQKIPVQPSSGDVLLSHNRASNF